VVKQGRTIEPSIAQQNSDSMGINHLHQKHMKNANCLQEFIHKMCSKCPPLARTHAWRRFLHWSIAVSIMSCQKSDHTAITRSFSSSIQQCLLFSGRYAAPSLSHAHVPTACSRLDLGRGC